MTSSRSGPVRLDEKGTLKDRLTILSPGGKGDIGPGRIWRLIECEMGLSIRGPLDIKAAGVILSKPCLACPAKLPNFCIVPHLTFVSGTLRRERGDYIKHPTKTGLKSLDIIRSVLCNVLEERGKLVVGFQAWMSE